VRISLKPRHVRNRLTLWYVGVLAGVLALYAGSALLVLRVSLRRELDEKLKAEVERVEEHLAEAGERLPSMGEHGGKEDRESLVEIWSMDGSLLYRSDRLGGETLGPPPTAEPGPFFTSLELHDGTPLRVLGHAHRLLGRSRLFLRVALSEEGLREEWHELLFGLLFGLPVAVTIAGLGGHWLARRALEPLDRMARHAERLTADNLGERLPVENPDDELGHLARVFNASLARIEESFAQLRRFTADVSHELRTPLTAIRSVGEVGLGSHPSEKEYRDIIGSILEESDRLALLVDTLLSLSRADAGEVRLNREDVDLLALAREIAGHLAVLAEEREQGLVVEGDRSVWVKADRLVLRQALVNIVDNAIKYSPPGGPIRIVVTGNGAMGHIDVIDTGPGIPRDDRDKVFERFYRVDPARSRDHGGAGLGLSIARWAVGAHGGTIGLESREGEGSAFRVTLPIDRPPAAAGTLPRSESVE
jgi:heavy metal sensor kinase